MWSIYICNNKERQAILSLTFWLIFSENHNIWYSERQDFPIKRSNRASSLEYLHKIK